MPTLTVYGHGPTTSVAYQEALAMRDDLTVGDRRQWIVSDQSYHVMRDKGESPHVVCELSLELIETMAND